MINEKNMFTFTIRKMGIQKENNIVPNDPSNIFEFTNKKRKKINFDDLLGVVKKGSSKNLSGEEKENKKGNNVKKKSNKELSNVKKENPTKKLNNVKKNNFEEKTNKENLTKKLINNKKNNVKKIDFRKEIKLINFNEKEDKNKKVNKINVKKYGIKEEKIESSIEIEKISDILLLFCRENSDEYSNKLHDLLIKNPSLFNNDPCEVEIFDLEKKIEELDIEQDKWMKMKKNVLDENILSIPNIVRREGCTEIIKEEEDDKLSKIIFLKDSMKSYLRNISERLNEIEQKIFNMTAHENEMDPLILLKALTRYN